MNEPIDSRDVLDADQRTTADFAGRIIGHFQPTGPDPWSGYEFVAEAGGEIEVMTGVEVQLEADRPAIRMRWRSRVVRVAWAEDNIDAAARTAFVAAHFKPFRGEGDIGAAAVIAEKLSGGREPSIND